jgi:tetratricopeptide (TPR) repeat protein
MKPEDLFSAIRDAFARADNAQLTRLCKENLELILESFAGWQRIPEEIRVDQAATTTWVQSLVLLAEMFDDAGVPELKLQLSGGERNPFVRWEGAFDRAQSLVVTGQYQEAILQLHPCLPEIEKSSGSVVDELRPKMYGLVGKAYYLLGNVEEARRFTQRALEDCRRIQDEEGIQAYSSNLRLMTASAPAPQGQLLRETRTTIARAQRLSDEVEFEKSNEMLLPLAGPRASSPVSEFQGKIWGLIGLNHFRLQNFKRAERFTQMALEHCRKSEDIDGIRIYSFNLECIADRLNKKSGEA